MLPNHNKFPLHKMNTKTCFCELTESAHFYSINTKLFIFSYVMRNNLFNLKNNK